ncbi:von Willebrand factor type A domain-containing protein [Ferruginibacter paludis]|uniref:vWA domain-containing protein n=1 Tax=Ferruginibacter paludis TaxID=1310417 RepID=UPI0025B53F02|nr:VWA domain-containing protein [Ferruginibacter paludis]MDN3654598.1 von Willebrand factor type A domain-containing protein [Ferruginibacter paludis]
MKKLAVYISFLLFVPFANAQYYLRGEIKNEKSELLQNVKILLHSDKNVYYSGTSGGFGISCHSAYDSLTLIADGYETKSFGVKTDAFQQLILKSLSANVTKNRPKLISVTKDQDFSSTYTWYVSDESYFSLVENETVDVNKFPNSAFSLNINKASYSNIRRFLTTKSLVPPDAVRIEELLNYFNLHYREPSKNEVFSLGSQLSECPWNAESKLLFLNVNARKLDMDKVPPSNLVFLIDASGSMDLPNRLPLVKAAFQMLIKNLRAIDTVSIVAYGGSVSVWLPPTSGAEKQKITASIEELTASGDTPGESAIRMAYGLAERSFIKGGNNRVILATDGDFNVGEVTEKALDELITKEKKSGVYLTCLGVGMGNFKDSKLETLAKRGNGNYAYLDNITEAEKVLVKEVTQTFFSVADDVFLNVHFNPAVIKDYRLIGFDNKRDAIADSSGELEGGDIGSGNSVLAIFEVTPKNAFAVDSGTQISPASVSLKYTLPATKNRREIKFDCPANYQSFNNIDKEYQLGASIAMFGMKLRQSKYFPVTDWTETERIATNAYNPDNYLQKQFVQLIGMAKKIYVKKKMKYKD